MKRTNPSTRSRFETFKRDCFTCQYCGRKPPSVTLHLDHIVPVSRGGTNERSNLITSCQECNAGKSDVPLGQVPDPIHKTLQDQVERMEQVKEYNKWISNVKKYRDMEFKVVEDAFLDMLGPHSDTYPLNPDWIVSLRTFLKDLPSGAVLEAMRITCERKPYTSWRGGAFKYFCGVCWSMIKQQAEANR